MGSLSEAAAETGRIYSKPLGIRFLEYIKKSSISYKTYQAIVLIVTFLAYTSYHAARKTTSIVKSTLDPQSSDVGLTFVPWMVSSSYKPTETSYFWRVLGNGWAPFNGSDGTALLGELDVAFLAVYAMGMYFSGHLGDRMNLRIFLTIGMVGTGLFTSLFGVGYWANVHSFYYFLVAQVFAGLFQSTGWPSVVAVVGNWFGKKKRGLIMGIWNAHTSVGNISGSLIASAMLAYGWGWSFVLPGLLIAFVGVIVFLFLPVSPESVGADREEDEMHSPKKTGATEPLLRRNTEVKEEAVGFIEAWKIPGVAPFALCLFFAKLVAYTFLYWLPFYISHTAIDGKYLSSQTAGTLSTLFDVGGVLGGILAGHISDRLDARAITAASFMYCAIPALFFYRSYGHISLTLNIILMFITGMFVNGPYALITTAVSADLGTHSSLKGNSRALATVTAIIDGTGSVGAAIGPLMTGYISAKSWTAVFTMLRNRNPNQHRPTVHGGFFTNRRHQPQQNLQKKKQNFTHSSSAFNIQKWDPHFLSQNQSQPSTQPSLSLPPPSRLSPIARFIVDAFRKNRNQWGPQVVTELRKLRRVTNSLVTEVLKVEKNPDLASKFFNWAGKQKGYKHNFACYNAYAYCLNRSNLFRAADQLPELMDSQGKAPSEKQFEILIRMHADNNRGLRVYYVYQKMKKFGIKPRTFLYNRIMDALVKNGYVDLALTVYQDFKADGLEEESVTYMILTKGLCKAGRIEEMLDFLGKMRENLFKPDIFAYTAIIRVLVAEGNLEGCLQVWEEMNGDGVEPDVMAYVTLVTGLCKGGRAEKAFELFKEMKEKGILIDRSIYRVLVEAFVKDRKVGTACDLLKDLMDSGYRADLGIYNSLIEGLCSVKHVDKAYKLFQVTVQEELEPDFVTVNPMLVCYAEMRRMSDFCKLLAQMGKLGFSVTDDLSKFFTSFLEKEDRIMMALEAFEDLKAKGHSSVPIYNTLMGVLLNNGEATKALSLYGDMKDRNLEPDSTSYGTAVSCFVEVGDIQEACACHNKIIEMSSVPSITSYRSLAKGLCKIGDIDSAMMLIRDCLASVPSGPTEFKYSLTILHVCRSGDPEKIIEVLNEMMQEGCYPDEVIYSAIICGMCKHGTLEGAKRVFSSLRDRKLLTEANMIVYDEMFVEHMKKKTADLVLSGLKFFGLESKLRAKGSTLLPS